MSRLPTLDAKQQPYNITLPPPCVTVARKLHFFSSSFGFCPTIVLITEPTMLNLLLWKNIISHHHVSGFKLCSRVNCKRILRLHSFMKNYLQVTCSIIHNSHQIILRIVSAFIFFLCSFAIFVTIFGAHNFRLRFIF